MYGFYVSPKNSTENVNILYNLVQNNVSIYLLWNTVFNSNKRLI